MAFLFAADGSLDVVPFQQLHLSMDATYPRPSRDVFKRVVAASHSCQFQWIASDADGMLGLVMLSSHSGLVISRTLLLLRTALETSASVIRWCKAVFTLLATSALPW